MDWIQVFDGFGVPVAMLIYFIWHSQTQDKEISIEREKWMEEFKSMRESHLNAEKDSLVKYAELTRHVTEVIATVQKEINVLTDKVAELASIIRDQIKH